MIRALRERGVTNVSSLVSVAADADELDGIEGAIRWYDERRKTQPASTGLLVTVIRDGGKPGYGLTSTLYETPKPVSPRLLQAVRGRCLSPDGCLWDDAAVMFNDVAHRRGLTVEALIAQAMGPRWRGTPPHPATLLHQSPELRAARQQQWINEPPRPDTNAVREPGEDADAFCARYWQWIDPPVEQDTKTPRPQEMS